MMNNEMPKYQEVLEIMLMALVSEPMKVQVSRKVDEMGVLLTVQVAQEDMGMVVGKEGKMSEALRTVVRGIGRREAAKVAVKILEPDGTDRSYARKGEE